MWAEVAYGMPPAKAGVDSRAALLIGFPRSSIDENWWKGKTWLTKQKNKKKDERNNERTKRNETKLSGTELS